MIAEMRGAEHAAELENALRKRSELIVSRNFQFFASRYTDIDVNFRKQVYAQTSKILASPSVIPPTKTDLDKRDRPRF